MTRTRQEATIRKIDRRVEKLLPKPDDADIAIGGYDHKMGVDIRDQESYSGGEGNEIQGDENRGDGNGEENREEQNGGEQNGGEQN